MRIFMDTVLNVADRVVSATMPGTMNAMYASGSSDMLPPIPNPKASRYRSGPTRLVTSTSMMFSLVYTRSPQATRYVSSSIDRGFMPGAPCPRR